jgi:endonuclease/exonuclease/phosphatase (EEP) superfamily protein YafD
MTKPDAFNPAPPAPRLIANICRCSTPHEHASRAASYASDSARADVERMSKEADARVAQATKKAADIAALTPDANQYTVERVERIGEHLVMQVRYPNCKVCAYEGVKTMVFLDVPEHAALRWKRIDPHFRIRTNDHFTAHPTDAPSPAARFPSSKEGWTDAVAYARGKGR